MTTSRFDVVIVGGGLAGLSAGAYLARMGKKVVIAERGVLGGRAVTLTIKGFHFNFGAHAIYARDSSVLRTFERELGLHIDWQDFNPNKVKYDLGDTLTAVPANIQGLFQSKALKGLDKLAFTYEVLKTLLHLEAGQPHLSIGAWLKRKQVADDVKDMMLTLASSNFFTSEPEKIPSEVFFNYYRRLFATNKPVAYIGGGWQSLINEFVRVIEHNGGVIMTKTKVEEARWEGDRITSVRAGECVFTGDEFIFCVPPKELAALLKGSAIEHALIPYSS